MSNPETFTFPTYFLSHGGGPWPFMKEQYGTRYDALEASLQDVPRQIGTRPKAVLIISSHWEGPQLMLSASPKPPMMYDYNGFPPHTYEVQYKAPGSPELAQRVKTLLDGAGQPASLDHQRGFDHGTFSMMTPMYPDASMPIVQLSLKTGYDPLTHLQIGRALAPLRSEGILILGSGLSYHNLRQFGPGGAQASRQFDAWLQHTMALAPAQRTAQLLDWDKAPAARQAHPQEDHLMPLMVALGAAETEAGACVYHESAFFNALTISSFRFGAAATS